MSSELFCLLKDQFAGCMKLLKMISDDEKVEAVEHIETALAEYDRKVVKVEYNAIADDQKLEKDSNTAEYFEKHMKEEEDVKPDIRKHLSKDAVGVPGVLDARGYTLEPGDRRSQGDRSHNVGERWREGDWEGTHRKSSRDHSREILDRFHASIRERSPNVPEKVSVDKKTGRGSGSSQKRKKEMKSLMYDATLFREMMKRKDLRDKMKSLLHEIARTSSNREVKEPSMNGV